MNDIRREMFEKAQAKLPEHERVADSVAEMCFAEHEGYKCTSKRGHIGDHASGGLLGDVEHRWKPVMTHVEININSHISAMCETTRPILCQKHLAEVRDDGDLLQVYGTTEEPCTMCAAEEKK